MKILQATITGILIIIAAIIISLLSFFVPAEAATNDDLAFDFISSEPSVFIAVDECVERGIYTINQGNLVKSDELIHEYNPDDFSDIKDFCQQTHEELYPSNYKSNKVIRGLAK